ncbi:hypothetical protein BO71DRAFT_393885 [Aspergillus ellipticus CBS 707.79]|uniref:Uncharacterized protein n=1 Tax=Aspergillus ellipticus CBS 707.79 TaxID=1448320 RepID=A0A319DUG1_9EURO|nr:hypothetical protein BO71DRAFT_393885 [Aspergillus ellipticus CBS 707.79]
MTSRCTATATLSRTTALFGSVVLRVWLPNSNQEPCIYYIYSVRVEGSVHGLIILFLSSGIGAQGRMVRREP